MAAGENISPISGLRIDISNKDKSAELMNKDSSDFQTPSSASPRQSGELSPEVSIGSVKSKEDLSDSDSMELFQPSSPFKVKEEFILPDIIEESEELELDSAEQDDMNNSDILSLHSSLDDGELDIQETTFNELNPGSTLDKSSSIDEAGMQNFEPPMLPISPPPGPLLSPDSSITTISSKPTTSHKQPSSLVSYNPTNSRHSIAGMMEDIPPPLPATQPPGKMISPRHSMFMDLADLSSELRPNSKGQLDMNRLVLKMSEVADIEEIENKKSSKEEKSTSVEEISESNSLKSDKVLTLVPPIQDHPDGDFDDSNPSVIRQRLGSYHLKTFEPPKEFSDSGFQDTDVAADQCSKVNSNASSGSAVVPSKPMFASDDEDGMVQKIDSSVTCTSDEQLTENSGSVGLVTIAASSRSEVGEHSLHM